MGRVGKGVRRVIAAVLVALMIVVGLACCEQTPLLSRVRALALTGKWDEGVFDSSIFGE